jgi:hypothetical protein
MPRLSAATTIPRGPALKSTATSPAKFARR